MDDEIGDQYWQLDVESIAGMLSPKILKLERPKYEPYPPLNSFICFSDDNAVQTALRSVPMPTAIKFVSTMKPNYLLAEFFNSCVHNCDAAYEKLRSELSSSSPFTLKPREDRWWPTLELFSYDRKTKDGYDGAAPLRPKLIAGERAPNGSGEPTCYWSMPPNPVPAAIKICVPVEVDNNWYGILKRAGMYALAQVSAFPLRLFTLVIGVNYKTHRMRFLIFHRGGLTVSHEIDLDEAEGHCAVQRIMVSILLWQDPEDADLPSFTNGVESQIPSLGGATPSVRVVADKLLFHSLSVGDRGTLVVRGIPTSQALSVRQPGCKPNQALARHLEGVQPQTGLVNCTPRDETTTKSISTIQSKRYYHDKPLQYVQPYGIVCKYLWPTSSKRQIKAEMYDTCNGQFGSNMNLSPPDYRTLFVTVTADEGSLDHCCLLHALLGWLSFMNIGGRGFLHRDVTIGNVMKLDKPVQRPEPSQRSRARQVSGEKVVIAAERLEKALAKIGVSTEYRALLIDGDTAADLETYFSSSEGAGVIFGTPEFMSRSLKKALMLDDKEYVQSLVDDLHFFVWTALWATVFNSWALEGAAPEKSQEVQQIWRDQLSRGGASRAHVLATISQRSTELCRLAHAPLVKGMSPLFRKWSSALDTLECDLYLAWRERDALPRQKLNMIYRFALEGVADYGELLYEQREQLQALHKLGSGHVVSP
ncbi:hypothetical protein L226DRAFT_563602 [Lentinus tigrinus ALCF2SS1-7]|uniref:uncharacterized protein n=1 Tax=Lentinus tigrinus ALCF2SS1-7 TaxID=1328758 RepID=UPI0011662E13|nr:hypothetical protein L226DRAFT_563602 [Lentinus tigrinus ALCF2SS1-7]